MDTITEWLAVPGVGELAGVIVGAVLAWVLRVVSEGRAFKRQARLDDRRYWRDQGRKTYLDVMRMVTVTMDALDDVERSSYDLSEGDPVVWLHEGLPKRAQALSTELMLFAPSQLAVLVARLTNHDLPRHGVQDLCLKVLVQLREHLGIERLGRMHRWRIDNHRLVRDVEAFVDQRLRGRRNED